MYDYFPEYYFTTGYWPDYYWPGTIEQEEEYLSFLFKSVNLIYAFNIFSEFEFSEDVINFESKTVDVALEFKEWESFEFKEVITFIFTRRDTW